MRVRSPRLKAVDANAEIGEDNVLEVESKQVRTSIGHALKVVILLRRGGKGAKSNDDV